MKCSLLTLSTFIDGELAPQRSAEVDAHLVGCPRCHAGAATLREEKTRVGQLARVTVDPGSAQLMLEQVGIIVDPVADRSPLMPPPPSVPEDARRPWQGGASSPALPWTPRRPEAVPAPRDVAAAATVAPDLQPDLPLGGVRSAPASWDAAVADQPDVVAMPAESPPVVADAVPPSSPAPAVEWAEADEDWMNAAVVPESWEAELPPPMDDAPVPAGPWTGAAAPAQPPVAPAPPPPDGASLPPPPTRLAAAAGPAALWARVRDAVTVRLALSRGGDALEDSAQIVSGGPPRRGAQLPTAPVPSMPPPAPGAAPSHPPAPPQAPVEVELNGVAGRARSFPPAIDDPTTRPEAGDEVAEQPAQHLPGLADDPAIAAGETAGWNAFAASSYPEAEAAAPADPHVSSRPRPLGRHSRAVARENVPLATQVTRVLGRMAASVRAGAASATARTRKSAGAITRTGPDNRIFAVIAGIGLIFVGALLIGHAVSHPATPTASRPPTTAPSTATQPHQSTPAQSSSAAAASAPAQVQTFGAGDTGFQVERLRYGAQTNYMRVVFDLGPVSGSPGGTPKATVTFSNPTTVLVTFAGTVPAGSTGTPTPGKVISSVTLVSTSGGKTIYRLGLTRPATATAFYLTSPTRFVLDIH